MKNFSFLKLLFLLFFLNTAGIVFSQSISSPDRKKLRQKEDSLKVLIEDLSVDSLTAGRMRSDSLFIRTLMRALQVKNSFYYPFDSLRGIKILYSPDTMFRIITWTLSFDDYYARQRGVIQFKTPDGSLKRVPLIDNSEFTTKPLDSVLTNNKWIGAVYYRMIKTSYNGKNYYTLFGFDNFSVQSNKKWIEVLTFNERKEPVFGGPFFSFAEDSAKKPVQYRFSVEYKKEANALINYEDELQIIIVDHLISENDEPENKWTYIPDGDYEGFKWKNGKWIHIDKVFTQKLEDGQAPVPDPIMDIKGKKNEEKLNEKSIKNKGKKDH